MIVHQPEISRKDGKVTLQARVETHNKTFNLPDFLRFTFPAQFERDLSMRADTFISPMLQVALALGEDLEIRGEASPRLVYGLDEFQKRLHHLRPDLFNRVNIHPMALSPAPRAKTAAQYASAFSGGIDSFHTLKNESIGGRLTHSLYLHGFADIPLIYQDMYDRMLARFAPICQDLGVELVSIRTNIIHFAAYLLEPGFFLEAPLISAALGLSPLLSGMFVASEGHNHYNQHLTSALFLPNLRTEQFVSMVSGTDSNRFEKTMRLADWGAVQHNLRICMEFPDQGEQLNCSKCAKCVRTRLTLHVLGKLDQFTVFKQGFTFTDYLRWGRWLESGYYREIVKHVFHHRRALIPPILLGLMIGCTRIFLRKILPKPILKRIFKLVSPVNKFDLFTADRKIDGRKSGDPS